MTYTDNDSVVTADDVDTAVADATTAPAEPTIESAIAHWIENSKIGSKGIREVSKAAYEHVMAEQGVDKATMKQVQEAMGYAASVAAQVAARDVEDKIDSASSDDMASDTFRRDIGATVRLPTYGGSTEITVYAEKSNSIPFRGEGDGPTHKITYGRIATTVNTKGFIAKNVQDDIQRRIREKLGMAE